MGSVGTTTRQLQRAEKGQSLQWDHELNGDLFVYTIWAQQQQLDQFNQLIEQHNKTTYQQNT